MGLRDAIVVGCGIVGATAARALRARGLSDVLVLDAGRPGAGTPPSGGHLRPGWFRDMTKDQYVPAMDLLDELWGLKREEFKLWPLGNRLTVHRVDTDLVVREPRTSAEVTELGFLHNYPLVRYRLLNNGGEVEERCRLLVVAAGVWAAELVSNLVITAKQGVSFRLKGRVEPLIRPWAPYKQVVVHQQGPDELWAGDGTALLPTNWTAERTEACLSRCLDAVGMDRSTRPTLVTSGLRPYCETAKTEPCLLRRLGPRAWVATGAGKMGTIAAGWAARKICEQGV